MSALEIAQYRAEFADFHISYNVERFVAGSKDGSGRWVAGSSSIIVITASPPQPIRMNELTLLEDGEQIADYVKIYSPDKLNTRLGAIDADIIQYDGNRYKVVQVENRESHYKIIMKRLN